HRDGLDCRVQSRQAPFLSRTAKPRTIGIGPDVRPVAAIATKLNIVAMGAAPHLENEDELVLRPIEAPHPSIGFGPDTKVEQLETMCLCRGEQLCNMPPVHADISEAAGKSVALHEAEGCSEEARKASRIHFSGRHLELAVMNFPKARDMAVDRHVEGRIGENGGGFFRAG